MICKQRGEAFPLKEHDSRVQAAKQLILSAKLFGLWVELHVKYGEASQSPFELLADMTVPFYCVLKSRIAQ